MNNYGHPLALNIWRSCHDAMVISTTITMIRNQHCGHSLAVAGSNPQCPWVTMVADLHLWLPLVTHVSRWVLMIHTSIPGYPLVPVDDHKCQWVPLDTSGYQGKHWGSWAIMRDFRRQWETKLPIETYQLLAQMCLTTMNWEIVTMNFTDDI